LSGSQTESQRKDEAKLVQKVNGPMVLNKARSDQSVHQILRRVYEDFNKTPLAQSWPIEDNQVEFVSRVKLFQLALPYLSRPQGVVFDIGTGGGIAARFFKGMGCRVVSVDSEAASGTAALENVRLAGVEGFPCDIERDALPAMSGFTDVVIFTDVIEHLHHSPKPALYEMMRILRPGGVVLASTPNALRLTVRMKVLMGASNWPRIWDYFDQPASHFGHHHEYTIEEFRGVFERTGFIVDKFSLEESNSLTAPLASLQDLQTGIRSSSKEGRSRFYLARRAIWACATMFPRLRSTMTLVARKPDGEF
jgi:SAM-dependent methyltransferase